MAQQGFSFLVLLVGLVDLVFWHIDWIGKIGAAGIPN